ncbi:MAG TPA: hypothetical protein VG148_01770 [Pyrinomonadaceae bacterium]|nr:hypothetical protein [Pyrinomonadaceae bacterium]
MLLLCAFALLTASAQTRRGDQTRRPAPGRPQEPSTIITPTAERAPAVVARESEVACGGFITTAAPAGALEIVGSDEERERRVFGEGDFVYVRGGAQHGMAVGQEFTVVRPRGRFRSPFSRKSGPLGIYTQEVGRVRVLRVRDQVSVAEVVRSCDNILLGDLLRPAARRAVPAERLGLTLDRFAEPTGKQTGRIVLARDTRELLSRDQVVFIDLGAEDNLKVGDYLTVFRPRKRGTFVEYGDEMAQNTRRGFESDEFRGGKFSNQAQRLKDVDGSSSGPTVKTPKIKSRRPPVPRQVVGELVVLHVEGRTATAVITRVIQEVHTGDHVEVQ